MVTTSYQSRLRIFRVARAITAIPKCIGGGRPDGVTLMYSILTIAKQIAKITGGMM